MPKFTPHLLIGIGKDYHFFTLRETYLHTTYLPGEGACGNSMVNGVYQGTVQTEVRSFHHFNLSTDPDEAWTSAMRIAGEMGLELVGCRQDLLNELEEIRRASKAELEARQAALEARRQAWAQEREEKRLQALADLLLGKISFGAKSGQTFEEQDPDYLQWVVSKEQEFEEGSIMRAMAQAIREHFAHLLPRAWANTYLDMGRTELWVRVRRTNVFSRPRYGREWQSESVCMVTMQDMATGACVMACTSNFRPLKGETLMIKATVHKHDDYKGMAQSWVNRVVVVANKNGELQ